MSTNRLPAGFRVERDEIVETFRREVAFTLVDEHIPGVALPKRVARAVLDVRAQRWFVAADEMPPRMTPVEMQVRIAALGWAAREAAERNGEATT
jgi:hypothetical protein